MKTVVIARTLKMEQKVIPGTLRYLEKLFSGPWDDEEFLVIPDGGIIRESDMRLM